MTNGRNTLEGLRDSGVIVGISKSKCGRWPHLFKGSLQYKSKEAENVEIKAVIEAEISGQISSICPINSVHYREGNTHQNIDSYIIHCNCF